VSRRPGAVLTLQRQARCRRSRSSTRRRGAGKDFGNRIVANVKFSTLPNDSAGDGRGHGTFVAGIAAGGVDNYTGATPQAPIVSLDVMDDNGVARTSDVIAAAQWILANKDKYNIRVANFSLHSGTKSHFFQDPLDQAVEKLWFNNVVVVAAAGNYGYPDKPSGVLYAPGNDPFVITVGAVDIGGTKNVHDDVNAPWSAYGRTPDGFMKPELAAPGRYMVGPVPEGSTLAVERADKVVAKGYIQLSGTSFAAPGDLRRGGADPGQAPGVHARPGQGRTDGVDEGRRRRGPGLGRGRRAPDEPGGDVPEPAESEQGARPVGEEEHAHRATRPSTRSAGSTSPSRTSPGTRSPGTRSPGPDAAWNVVSWADVSWADVSWADVSWADVSWADVSWADTSYEDAAEGDTTGDPAGYELTPEQAAEIMADPETAPDPSALPAHRSGCRGRRAGTASGHRPRRRTGHNTSGEGREQSRPSLVRGIFGPYRKRGM
jgi:serine protease AprX